MQLRRNLWLDWVIWFGLFFVWGFPPPPPPSCSQEAEYADGTGGERKASF